MFKIIYLLKIIIDLYNLLQIWLNNIGINIYIFNIFYFILIKTYLFRLFFVFIN